MYTYAEMQLLQVHLISLMPQKIKMLNPALYNEIPHIYSKQEYVGLLHNKDNICLIMETEDTIIGFCLASINVFMYYKIFTFLSNKKGR